MLIWALLLGETVGVSRHAASVPASFEDIYERYHPLIVRYLTQMCGSADQAEELAQETFVKAYVGMVRFRGEASTTTWLYRIARNTYLNSVRRPAHARLDAPDARQVADRCGDPVRAFTERETKALISRALAELPEQQRSILLLRDAEGLAYGEIADVLGISVAAVRMKLFRARNMFRYSWQEMSAGGDDE